MPASHRAHRRPAPACRTCARPTRGGGPASGLGERAAATGRRPRVPERRPPPPLARWPAPMRRGRPGAQGALALPLGGVGKTGPLPAPGPPGRHVCLSARPPAFLLRGPEPSRPGLPPRRGPLTRLPGARTTRQPPHACAGTRKHKCVRGAVPQPARGPSTAWTPVQPRAHLRVGGPRKPHTSCACVHRPHVYGGHGPCHTTHMCRTSHPHRTASGCDVVSLLAHRGSLHTDP